jgi:hypothetical protein
MPIPAVQAFADASLQTSSPLSFDDSTRRPDSPW